ncbi:hypothetical protein RvY_07455-2 [Ramazzottius varieornatus]|uniref:Uncharacterized protein n=1 Tax=Ramazzottius varieornatus TaxID=947166 RepID=A0A1D1V8C2_RAMVA|nr:hypothetical protein RvY_07455-2 [Ramazzottius varieornatus]
MPLFPNDFDGSVRLPAKSSQPRMPEGKKAKPVKNLSSSSAPTKRSPENITDASPSKEQKTQQPRDETVAEPSTLVGTEVYKKDHVRCIGLQVHRKLCSGKWNRLTIKDGFQRQVLGSLTVQHLSS